MANLSEYSYTLQRNTLYTAVGYIDGFKVSDYVWMLEFQVID